jgi:hypothetical protein
MRNAFQFDLKESKEGGMFSPMSVDKAKHNNFEQAHSSLGRFSKFDPDNQFGNKTSVADPGHTFKEAFSALALTQHGQDSRFSNFSNYDI